MLSLSISVSLSFLPPIPHTSPLLFYILSPACVRVLLKNYIQVLFLVSVPFFFFFFETYLYPSFINQANSIIRPLNSIIISAFSFSFPISVYSLLSFPLKQLFASKLALRNITHTPNNNAQLAFMISVPTKCQL